MTRWEVRPSSCSRPVISAGQPHAQTPTFLLSVYWKLTTISYFTGHINKCILYDFQLSTYKYLTDNINICSSFICIEHNDAESAARTEIILQILQYLVKMCQVKTCQILTTQWKHLMIGCLCSMAPLEPVRYLAKPSADYLGPWATYIIIYESRLVADEATLHSRNFQFDSIKTMLY